MSLRDLVAIRGNHDFYTVCKYKICKTNPYKYYNYNLKFSERIGIKLHKYI